MKIIRSFQGKKTEVFWSPEEEKKMENQGNNLTEKQEEELPEKYYKTDEVNEEDNPNIYFEEWIHTM